MVSTSFQTDHRTFFNVVWNSAICAARGQVNRVVRAGRSAHPVQNRGAQFLDEMLGWLRVLVFAAGGI